MKNLSFLLVLLQTSNVFAASHIETSSESRKISVTGTTANTASPVTANMEDVVLTATETLVTHEEIPTIVYTCEDVESDGTQGEWNDFYTVPAYKKADALKNSILGVGEKTAPYLVPYFMDGKPRSWSAFAKLINKAAKDLDAKEGISTAWATQVLQRYKEQNMKNLGYLAGGCTGTVTVFTYDNREKIRELNALVKVKVQNMSLLPGETEEMTVTYDGKNVKVSAASTYNQVSSNVSLSDYGNRYDTSAVVTLTGTSRKQVTPSNLVDNRNSSIATDGTLSVSHAGYTSMMNNPVFAEKCKAVLAASVIATTGSFWNSKDRTTSTKDVALDLSAGHTTASLGSLGLSTKEEASVSYTVRFAPGCPFYNTNPSLQSIIQ